jgi:hypothetical protein
MSKASAERTKVVVRNLPPTLSREAFLNAIDKHAEGTYNLLAYYPGKVRYVIVVINALTGVRD